MYNVVILTENREMSKTIISKLLDAGFEDWKIDPQGIYFQDEELEKYKTLKEIAKENGAICTKF